MSVLSDPVNKPAKRARHSSPQSNKQAAPPTASAAQELLSSGSPSPEQPDVYDCEAELPLQPDIEQELPSSGDTESGKLAAVKENKGHFLMQIRKKNPHLMRRVQARNQQVSTQ